MRLLLCLLLGAPILTAASSASAADEKETCLDAHVDAQASMKRGHVGESRIKLAVCSRKTCPKPITDDCVRWLDEAERAQPSVVVAVRDASGIDVPGARLWVDEVLVADRLDGRPIEVDPGEHVLRASSSARGETSNELRVIVRAGEKARPLAITLEAPSPPTRPATQRPPSATPTAPPPPRAGVPITSFVLGGVGVLGIGTFAFFGTTGNGNKADYERTCAPNCAAGDVEGIRRDYLVADVALGVSIVALGVAAVLAVASSGGASPVRSSSSVAAR